MKITNLLRYGEITDRRGLWLLQIDEKEFFYSAIKENDGGASTAFFARGYLREGFYYVSGTYIPLDEQNPAASINKLLKLCLLQ